LSLHKAQPLLPLFIRCFSRVTFSEFILQVNSLIWGLPLIILLVGTGLFLTLSLGGIQVRGFSHALAILRGKYDNPKDPGEISHFKALSAALSATIGTGNIVGVAAAILIGGPGAVFWMWVTALVGMATKFASCTLAVKYRRIDERGEVHAGPMYFIEMGLGPRFKWLAVLFATFTAMASFGIGNMFQANNMASSFNALVLGEGEPLSGALCLGIGLLTAFLVALVILGGIRRIAVVTSFLVPFMCCFYLLGGIIILVKNWQLVPEGFLLIFKYAFEAPEAVSGGLIGGVIRSGVARGLFSNEAGLGSAPMAHGAARTNEPVREGLVAMLGPFIDTIVVCSITALVIICTGAYETHHLKGQLTSVAFESGLPGSGWMVSASILLFAFSTIITWSYYGDRAVDYLFGRGAVKPYRLIYVGFIILGSMRPLEQVIIFCDTMNGLMALPNLIALLALSPVLVTMTKDYTERFFT
jgi:alanine or glycine:cation symporter, AGCS family